MDKGVLIKQITAPLNLENISLTEISTKSIAFNNVTEGEIVKDNSKTSRIFHLNFSLLDDFDKLYCFYIIFSMDISKNSKLVRQNNLLSITDLCEYQLVALSPLLKTHKKNKYYIIALNKYTYYKINLSFKQSLIISLFINGFINNKYPIPSIFKSYLILNDHIDKISMMYSHGYASALSIVNLLPYYKYGFFYAVIKIDTSAFKILYPYDKDELIMIVDLPITNKFKWFFSKSKLISLYPSLNEYCDKLKQEGKEYQITSFPVEFKYSYYESPTTIISKTERISWGSYSKDAMIFEFDNSMNNNGSFFSDISEMVEKEINKR